MWDIVCCCFVWYFLFCIYWIDLLGYSVLGLGFEKIISLIWEINLCLIFNCWMWWIVNGVWFGIFILERIIIVIWLLFVLISICMLCSFFVVLVDMNFLRKVVWFVVMRWFCLVICILFVNGILFVFFVRIVLK